jgi:hypothetical protein
MFSSILNPPQCSLRGPGPVNDDLILKWLFCQKCIKDLQTKECSLIHKAKLFYINCGKSSKKYLFPLVFVFFALLLFSDVRSEQKYTIRLHIVNRFHSLPLKYYTHFVYSINYVIYWSWELIYRVSVTYRIFKGPFKLGSFFCQIPTTVKHCRQLTNFFRMSMARVMWA